MLAPGDRMLVLESLRPPAGTQLDIAIGTSYTLDLLALLTAPLAFTFFDWEDRDGRPTADPIALLESVRRNADRIHMFCEAGALKAPRAGEALLPWIEQSVIEVQAPRGGTFHPKLWALRFVPRDEKDSVQYRVLCLSRNLTFDRSWDVALALDGTLLDRQRGIAANHPLADLVEALPTMAVRQPVRDATLGAIKRVADELRRVRFDAPPGFDPEIAFHAMGVGGRDSWPFPDARRGFLVVSPFLSESTLDRLARNRARCFLISRPESLEACSREALAEFQSVQVLAPDVDAEPDGSEDEVSAVDETGLEGLHAKLYVMDEGWDARIWIGSANATVAAFSRNVDLLVELRGRKKDCGIDALLGADTGGLSSILAPWTPSGDRLVDDATCIAQAALDERLREARLAIARAPWTLALLPGANDGEVALEARLDSVPEGVPPGLRMRCWPAAVREEAARDVVLTPGTVAAWPAVALVHVTSFLSIELTLEADGLSAFARFAVNARLEGAPADRLSRQLVEILRDADILRLLWILLRGEEIAVGDFVQAAARPSVAGAGRAGAGAPPALLEAMLHALADDPHRLDDLGRLIGDLSRTPDGLALLPKALMSVWESIRQARHGRPR